MKSNKINEGQWVAKSLDGVEKRFAANDVAGRDAWTGSYAKPQKTPVAQHPPKLTLDQVWRKVEDVVGRIFPDGDPIDWLAPWLQQQGIKDFKIGEILDRAAKKNGYKDIYDYYDEMKRQYAADTANEGTMGGINRSAPAFDVSYEKILDEVYQKWNEEKQLNELSVDKLLKFQQNIKSPERFKTASLSQIRRDVEGNQRAQRKINTKTGVARQGPPARGTNESMDDTSEKLATMKQWALDNYTKGADTFVEAYDDKDLLKILADSNGDLADALDFMQQMASIWSERQADADYYSRGEVDEDLRTDFADILGKQHKEKEVQKKNPTKDIPFNGWTIRYRPAQPGGKTEWMVLDKRGDIKGKGSSFSDKEAVGDAEEYIKTGAGSTQQSTKNVTIDFNVDFAKEFTPDGGTMYVMFDSNGSHPTLYLSTEPQKGFKKTHIRNQKSKITGETSLLPMVSMSANEANSLKLQPNGRYILGDKDVIDNNTVAFPLIYQSTVQGKGDLMKLGRPGLTVAHERDLDEEYRGVWQGDAEKLAKAPKSSMQGADGVSFSQIVQDTIREHGVKWAFDYYVKKHGLPPRQFQIFAGLTANKPKAVPQPAPKEEPKAPEKQSWWKKLRGKLPFEE